MLGLLPSIHCTDPLYTTAHVTTTDTTTSVMQLPLNLLHRAANYCTATQLLRSKQLKDPWPIIDKQVRLHLIIEAPLAVALSCPLEATAMLHLCIA